MSWCKVKHFALLQSRIGGTASLRAWQQMLPHPHRSMHTDAEMLVEVSNGIRKLTFNRPEKKNAMTLSMARTLIKGLFEANDDDKTKIVVVTGQGEYFTSGMDLSSPPKAQASQKEGSATGSNRDKPSKKGQAVEIFLTALVECRKPLVALVNGPALGFGVTMLGLFDNVYASDKATFRTRFTQMGLPPELGSTYTFPHILGYAKASNLLIFNQDMNAEEAYKFGLVSKLIPHQEFEKVTTDILNSFSNLPLNSLVHSKELVKRNFSTVIKEVSNSEQQYFDPEVARQVKEQYNKNKKP